MKEDNFLDRIKWMFKKCLFCFLTAAFLFGALPVAAESTDTISFDAREISFSADWEFQLNEEIDESAWTTVDLPHDWSIYTDYTTEGEAESGFLLGGVGYYRKSFIMPEEYEGKRIVITFEGIMQYSEIYVNDKKVGEHPYGYTSASYDLSDVLRYGGENTILVKVTNLVPSSRWYSGSGIYRDVTLSCTDQICIEENGTVITNGDLTKKKVVTTIETDVLNGDEDTYVINRILDEDGKEVAYKEGNVKDGNATVSLSFENVHLWDTEDPYLYTVVSEVYEGDTLTDREETYYGYRAIAFDSDTGFYLNGEPLKLKGVCLHHDHGSLGSVASHSAINRQLDTLEEMGVNAIRTAHNPADSYFLEQCAKRGILVIEEAFDTWTNVKNYNWNDYGSMFLETVSEENSLLGSYAGETWAEYDIKQMVKDARNNPAVILWSIGNEILGNIGGDTEDYPDIAEELCAWVKEEDDTRFCTIADNMTTDEDNETQIAMDSAVVKSGGIIGLNYATEESAEKYHTEHPDWCLYGSETASSYYTRSEYSTLKINEDEHTVTAYDRKYVEWGNTANNAWLETITKDYIAGEFVWTGYDYLGEPEPWNGLQEGSVTDGSPSPRSSYFGLVDTSGFKKDAYYYYQSQWNDDVTTLHILPCWHKECVKRSLFGYVEVNVYSDAPMVELFLNGKSLGKKSYTEYTTDAGYIYQTYQGKTYYTWKVRYKAGTLKAVAYDEDGNVIEDTEGRSEVSGSADSVLSDFTVTADETKLSADGQDLSHVTVTLLDEDGNVADFSDAKVSVKVTGEGKLVSLDNGNQNDIEGYHTGEKNAFHGQLLAIAGSTKTAGKMTVEVTVEGLGTKKVMIQTYD